MVKLLINSCLLKKYKRKPNLCSIVWVKISSLSFASLLSSSTESAVFLIISLKALTLSHFL